jgi:hypothetical protein
VGFLRGDGIVMIAWVRDSSGWRTPDVDSAGMPENPLPRKWHITPTVGRPFTVASGTAVRVPYETEDGSYSFLGQLTDARRSRYWEDDPGGLGLALSDPLGASMFHTAAASGRANASLLNLVRQRFQDSAARTRLYVVQEKHLPPPTMNPIHQVRLWRARVPASPDTVFAVEATRCYPTPGFGPCVEMTVFDLWVVKHGTAFQVVGERAPIVADEDFKGGTSLTPVAVFRSSDGTFMLFQEGSYSGSAEQIWELLATSSRNVTPRGSAAP